ncbi:MAG: electron transport complex subunit RsxA [Candidatus Omnitrophica bacterium]|nr:electron transport complex subunit RsxA [Candidatus Omnitrophota bacterium]
MAEYIFILVSAIFVNNFVLARFLGICPFLGVSKKTETALGMGAAVIFVMFFASLATHSLYNYVLEPYGVSYLRTIVFILVIASLVQIIETILKKISPVLYNALGIYLPLITTNCAILGVAILNIDLKYSLLKSLVFAIGSGIGFTIALLLMSGIRERLDTADVPESFKGVPIALVTAGLLSVSFLGFSGLFVSFIK